jgi:C4-dicarboxylate transporter DctM subunit
MELYFLIITFLVLMAVGIPVAFAIGLSSLGYLLLAGKYPLILIPQRIIVSSDSFVLLAIPYFLLAGFLMEEAGISQRLVNLANVMVRHIRGGLGHVVVVSEMLFSGISGSTAADVSAMTSMLLPGLKKEGYTPEHSVAIISAASSAGMLVPPCINMIILAEIMNISVARLFFAGFLPAIVLSLVIMACIYYQAYRAKTKTERRASLKELWKAMVESIIPLGMPIIIFGGILGGFFSPTEAGAIAVLYAFFFGAFVYRKIKIHTLLHCLLETAVNTGIVLLIIGTASIFSYILAVEGVPKLMYEAVTNFTDSPIVFLLIVTGGLLFIGMLLEGIAAMLIFVPIFLPAIKSLAIDPIHFGIIIITTIGIGLFTPPVGVGLVIGCTVANVKVEPVTVRLWPFLILLIIGDLLLIIFPSISTIVPNLLFD